MDCAAQLVPLADWTHDLKAMLARVNERTKLFFITNRTTRRGR